VTLLVWHVVAQGPARCPSTVNQLQPELDSQIFHCSSRYCRSKLRLERVCGAYAMNAVTLASA
jgi:hypothetical protein